MCDFSVVIKEFQKESNKKKHTHKDKKEKFVEVGFEFRVCQFMSTFVSWREVKLDVFIYGTRSYETQISLVHERPDFRLS